MLLIFSKCQLSPFFFWHPFIVWLFVCLALHFACLLCVCLFVCLFGGTAAGSLINCHFYCHFSPPTRWLPLLSTTKIHCLGPRARASEQTASLEEDWQRHSVRHRLACGWGPHSTAAGAFPPFNCLLCGNWPFAALRWLNARYHISPWLLGNYDTYQLGGNLVWDFRSKRENIPYCCCLGSCNCSVN